jgi:DNA-binding NarL/FixJ family response regulator
MGTDRGRTPRVLLVDDHPLWRQTLRDLLEIHVDAEIVGEASSRADAVALSARARPDVVLMDVYLADGSGIDATREIVERTPSTRVLVLSSSAERADVVGALQSGALGYVLKTAGAAELADAVRRVYEGQIVLPPDLAPIVLDELRHGSTRAAPAERNELRRDGDGWVVVFRGVRTRVPDLQGLALLQHLIGSPSTELHVLDLAGAIGRGVAGRELGPVLDASAKRAYRARLVEVEREIEDAAICHDGERAARARSERDAIVDELQRAVGRAGRDRAPGSPIERARLNVSRSIRRAIAALHDLDPVLGRHLELAVRTGVYCAYEPDPSLAVDWHVSSLSPD